MFRASYSHLIPILDTDANMKMVAHVSQWIDSVHCDTAKNIGENSSQLISQDPNDADQRDPETVPSPETGVKHPCQCLCNINSGINLNIANSHHQPHLTSTSPRISSDEPDLQQHISLTLSVGLAHLDAYACIHHARPHHHHAVVSAGSPSLKVQNTIDASLIDDTSSGQERSSAESVMCSVFRALSRVIISLH